VESLRSACRAPNADQPFACTDLMYLAALADKVLGMRQGSVLRSPRRVSAAPGRSPALTGHWPLAAALHAHESGRY